MINEYLETLGKYIRYKKEYVGNDTYRLYIKKNEMEFLEKSLQRLESIDNANPSEALECLNNMYELACDSRKPEYGLYECINKALLKAQKQENENNELKRVLEILKPDLRLVGNFLQARMPLVEDNDRWIIVKEIADEEELEVLKKILGQTQI